MNLSDSTNILLAKKAVYAEQLFYYSKLCKIYQDLALEAKSRPFATSTDDIESKYAEPLSRIVASDDIAKTLQELGNETIFSEEYIGSKYSQKELSHFSNFAKMSNIFKTYQTASSYLDAVSNSSGNNREKALSRFHKYMQNPKRPNSIRNFDKLISVHSPRYIGSRFFSIASKSIGDISQIDYSHIPLDPIIINQSLTPEKFGAIISGYHTIEANIENLEQNQNHTDDFDIDNWDLSNNLEEKSYQAEVEFDETNGSLKENAFVVGSKIKKVFSAHKGTLKKAVLIAASVAAIVGAAHQVGKEVSAHNLDIFESTQYEQTVTDQTKQEIDNIMQQLNLQKDAFDPQQQDVSTIEENIDLVLDQIVKDQVTTAFEAYHQDWEVTDVTSWFDKRYQGSANSEPSPFEFIDVTYRDKKTGQEGKESIHNFTSSFITSNHLQEIFELEESIDLDSPVWSAFNNDGTKNFLARAHSIEEVMQYLQDAVKVTRHVASFGVKHGHNLFNEPYLKSTLPEKDEGR